VVITWQQLKDAREASGLTQTALAALVRVHPKTIVNWEANRVPQKAEYKVERVLGDYLRTRASAGRTANPRPNRDGQGDPPASMPVVHLIPRAAGLDLCPENISFLSDKTLNAALAMELRLELARMNISSSAASKATGIKIGLVRKMLGGERRITFLELWRICTALEIDPQRIERQAFRSAIQQTLEETQKKTIHESRLVKHAEEYL